MSMKEYTNKIALLASAFIKNMKKEVEARQYTIIGSNLLEEMSDGKDLGTMTDCVLMPVATGMEEDMTDKQLQNSFLADGSTLRKKLIPLQKVLKKKKRLMLIKCGKERTLQMK